VDEDNTPGAETDIISAAVSLRFRRLKLPKGASHSLRHSHCSHCWPADAAAGGVRAAGHGSMRTTQEIYSQMIHGQDDDAARKGEEFQNQRAGGESGQKNRCNRACVPGPPEVERTKEPRTAHERVRRRQARCRNLAFLFPPRHKNEGSRDSSTPNKRAKPVRPICSRRDSRIDQGRLAKTAELARDAIC
jgi:hypothetical protein